MSYLEVRKTNIEPLTEYKVLYKRRSALLGLITWWEEVSREAVGNDIFIRTGDVPRRIYLNGEQIYPTSEAYAKGFKDGALQK